MGNLNNNFNDENFEKPIPFNDESIPFDDSDNGIDSDEPIKLDDIQPQKIKIPDKGSVKKSEKIVSSERITGVKTFYTKLHVGGINYIDEQINDWLRDNPGIVIKKTNTVTGMVVSKTTEPSIIVTVWY